MRNDSDEQLICPKHNLKSIYTKLDKKSLTQIFACFQCIQEENKTIPNKINKMEKNLHLIECFESQAQSNSDKMNSLLCQLFSIKSAIKKNIGSLIDEIRKKIYFTDELIKDLKTSNVQKVYLQQQHYKYQQSLTNFQRIAVEQIANIKQIHAFDQVVDLLQQIDLKNLNYEKPRQQIRFIDQKNLNYDKPISEINFLDIIEPTPEFQDIQQKQQKVQQYKYNLLPYATADHREGCFALAINKDSSIIVAAYELCIKVFEFKSEELQKVQKLSGHGKVVSCLQFMKQKNQFISGDWNHKIMIWQQISNQQWINTEILDGHVGRLQCIVLNLMDDCIISGGQDCLINIYILNKKTWNLDQQIKCANMVNCLSLNESNTQFISSQSDDTISVFSFQGMKWFQVQSIAVNNFGYNLCFISDNEFVYLPKQGENLIFYAFNHLKKCFEEFNQLKIENCEKDFPGFPIQFIKSKNLLIVKYGQFVNIIRKEVNSNFILDESIDFLCDSLYGCVSDDGNFMVTKVASKIILEVRKLEIVYCNQQQN